MQLFITFYNRIYFATYNILFFMKHYLLGMLIEWLFCRPMYAIPFVKQRIDRQYSSFDSWMEYNNRFHENPKVSILMYYTNAAITHVFFIPFYFCISTLEVIIGSSFRNYFFGHLIFFIAAIVILSVIFHHFVLWKNDRYLEHFAEFEKEGRKKKIAWSLGTFLNTTLLTIAAFFLFRYAEMELGYWR